MQQALQQVLQLAPVALDSIAAVGIAVGIAVAEVGSSLLMKEERVVASRLTARSHLSAEGQAAATGTVGVVEQQDAQLW